MLYGRNHIVKMEKKKLKKKEPTHWRRPGCWERLKAEGEGDGWHYRLNGHEFEQAPGDGEGQESLECCSL